MAKFKRMSKRGLSVILVCMMLLSCMTPVIALDSPEKNSVTITFPQEFDNVAFYGGSDTKLTGKKTLVTNNPSDNLYMGFLSGYYTYTFYAVPQSEGADSFDEPMPNLSIKSKPDNIAENPEYVNIDKAGYAVTLKLPKSIVMLQGIAFEVTVIDSVETFDVNVRTSGDGFTVDKPGVNPVENEKGFELTITLSPSRRAGYKPQVYDNDTLIDDTKVTSLDNGKSYTYKLDQVTSAHTIDVSLVPITFTVKRDEGTENWKNVETTLRDGGETVNYGSNYTFSLAPVAGHTLANEPVTITMAQDSAKAKTLTKGTDYVVVGNQYTIYNITGDVTVTLKAVTEQKFNVNWPTDTGYTIVSDSGSDITADEKSVVYGDTFKFKVKLDPAYSKSERNVVVTVNGQILPVGDDKIYTISDIKENKTILVNGVTLNTYNITHIQTGNGYTFSSQSSMSNVPHGSSFSFTVTPVTGYTIESVKYKKSSEVADNGTSLESNGNVYTIDKVEDNLTITVTATTSTYTLTLPNKDTERKGYTIKIGNEEAGNSKVCNYNDPVELTIAPKKGYTVTGVYRVVDGERSLVYGANNNYTIRVTSDMKIVVETDTIKYTVTYQDSKGGTTTKTYDVETGVNLEKGSPEITVDIADPTHAYYTFEGWSNAQNSQNSNVKKGGTIVLATGETSATVTAQWTLNLSALETNTAGASTKALGGTVTYDKEDHEKLTIKVTWNLGVFREAISEVANANYDIVSVGICYSNQKITETDTNWQTNVKNLTNEKTEKEGEVIVNSNQHLYYYVDGRVLAEQADTATFKFSNVRKPRYAIGWITVRIGNNENDTVTLYTGEISYTEFDS